jgi:hypothetical protein
MAGSGKSDDPWGIWMKYPLSKSSDAPKQWYMDHDPTGTKDPRARKFNGEVSGDGKNRVLHVRPSDTGSKGQVRMNVYSKSAADYKNKKPEFDHIKISERKFMQTKSDWRNVEMTAYLYVNDFRSEDKDENFAWYARSGLHGNKATAMHKHCEGTSYKASLKWDDGNCRWRKELWHNEGYAPGGGDKWKKGVQGGMKNKWVGLKAIIRDVKKNDKDATKLELYIHKGKKENLEDEELPETGLGKNESDWELVHSHEDKEGWKLKSEHLNKYKSCKGVPDQVITWGGPVATFRWDGKPDVFFKCASVREIAVPSD